MTRTPSRVRIALVAAAAFCLVVLGAAGASAQTEPEFTLDIGTIAPDNTPWAQQLQELDARFERESGGRLRVRVFLGSPDGELSLVRQCQDGTYQAVGVSTGAVAAVVPQLGVFELPYLFSSLEEADRIIDNVLFEPISEVLRTNGFQLYLFSENGYRNFATRGVEIHTPENLAGLQMRVQESWIHEEMYNALGGNAVRIAVPEVITALNTGQVQGFDNTPLFAFAASWFQGVDTWTVSDHIYQPAVIMYNAAWYDSLPEDLQQIVLSNIPQETQSGRALIRALTPALLNNLSNAGVSVYHMTDEEKAVFAERTRPVHDMFRERVEGGGTLLDLIYAAQ
jgi:TRAP-type C4-dicarboxylate transport system substrate-binding protein